MVTKKVYYSLFYDISIEIRIYRLSPVSMKDTLPTETGTGHRSRNLFGTLLGIVGQLVFDLKSDSVATSERILAIAVQQSNNSNGTA